jgi:low temperature requirement protein LtrA
VHRVLTLLEMLAVAALAINVHDGTGGNAAGFALAYVAVRGVLILEYVRVRRHVPEAAALTTRYITGFSVAAALWLVSAVVPPPTRFLLWALGMAIDIGTPATAGRLHAQLPPSSAHLPERFGLFVILVLGESIAAIAVGVHETHWQPVTVTIAVLGFVVAVSLWWTYFDLAGAGATHTLADRGGHRSTVLHDIYAYGHWPIALGLAAAGVGLEGAILQGGQPTLGSGIRWILCGGVGLYLLALTAIQGGTAGSLRSSLPWPGIGIPLILAVGFASDVRPVVLLAAVTLVLVGEVVAGLLKQRRGTLTTPDPEAAP